MSSSTIQELIANAKESSVSGARPAAQGDGIRGATDTLLASMRKLGHQFAVGKDFRDNPAVLLQPKNGAGPDLYMDLVPSVVTWAELSGQGNNGQTLPMGGEIDEGQAKFSLTVRAGLNQGVTYDLDEADQEALASAQVEQRAHIQGMCDEFWNWAFDNAEKVPNLLKAKTEALNTAMMAIEMAQGRTVPATDEAVVAFARKKFVGGARSPFTLSKDGEQRFKAAQKVFKRDPNNKSGFVPRYAPRVFQHGTCLNDNDKETIHVRSKDLVAQRVRFKTWSAPFGYGISCDLIKVDLLASGGGGGGGGKKRAPEESPFSAMFAKRARA